jgi:translation initiation factor 2 alpha subunit (eIF-2alpha)
VKIFLDDKRFPKAGWSLVRNVDDFLWMWHHNRHEITDISFDYDLGGEYTGYDCLKIVERDVLAGVVSVPPRMEIHSMNPVGVEKMREVIKNIYTVKSPTLDI